MALRIAVSTALGMGSSLCAGAHRLGERQKVKLLCFFLSRKKPAAERQKARTLLFLKKKKQKDFTYLAPIPATRR
jgi:hypothetical protein